VQLTELQRNWNVFGETDPLWSVLTDVRFKNNKWDPAAFFQTGEHEIDAVLAGFESMGISLPRRRALDFGCAVGRLTQALCRHFDSCDGVDIAPSMIELARKYDQYPTRCHYHLNGTDNLALFPDNTFDFVYSRLVLQHMQPRYSKKYIQEFLRVLTPGGVALFQIPAGTQKPDAQTPNPFDLPAAGFRASLSVESPPETIGAGSPFSINVSVTNLSPIAWPESKDGNGRDLVVLGNHWLTKDGRVVVIDDGRTPLMQGLKPSETATIQLWVTAPTAAGTYILELDMVKEGVAWFNQRGSKTFRTKVEIRGVAGLEPSAKQPVMEMHCVTKLEVLAVIKAAGGRAILVMDDHSADPLLGYQYVVTKTNEPRRPVAPPQHANFASILAGPSSISADSSGASDEISEMLSGLAQHAALQTRVDEALAKRLLKMENLAQETHRLVSQLAAGTPRGGRFAVYQGNNTALTRILNRHFMYVDTNDLSLTPHLMTQGQWEPSISNLFVRLVRPGMTVVDIGAHFGYYTILAGSQVGSAGKVYAIEPDSRNYEILRMNVESNGLGDLVQTRQCAVLNVKGQMELRRNHALFGRHSLFAGPKSDPENAWVEALPLDDIVRDSIDLIKIDAEGSEPFIFDGMSGALARSPKVQIILGFNVPMLNLVGVEPSSFLRKIQQQNFKVSMIPAEGSLEPLNEKKLLEGPLCDLLLTRG
jgi:FkbM family methyltransferase